MIILIILFAALATAALVVVVGIILGRREATIERRLAGYERAPQTAATSSDDSGATTQALKSAVDFTTDIAERSGLLAKVERSLERGDVPMRAGELIFYTAAISVLLFLLLTLLVSWLWGLIGAGLAVIAPIAYVNRKQAMRQSAFERQLPDTLTLLASSLRAGFSFMQGLEAVAQEIGAPMRRELQRVFTEVRLGRSPEDALEDAADRMGSTDLAWTVMAIKIQREVGGNLASLLDTVADTMQKRDRIRREIKALTAEGRLSAIILGLLPFVAGLGLFVVAPDYMHTLFSHGIGIAALIGGAVLALVGWFWLQRIINIEV
jgi:tight adherence protein B